MCCIIRVCKTNDIEQTWSKWMTVLACRNKCLNQDYSPKKWISGLGPLDGKTISSLMVWQHRTVMQKLTK